MRDILIEFMDSIRDYVVESGTNVAHDERDSSEFVDIFLNRGQSLPIDSADIGNPTQLEPVLAQIDHLNDLGKPKWYEVVYFDDKWRSYAGSKTFEDGEQVVKWSYAKDCL